MFHKNAVQWERGASVRNFRTGRWELRVIAVIRVSWR